MAGDLFPLIHNIFTANILEKWGKGGRGVGVVIHKIYEASIPTQESRG